MCALKRNALGKGLSALLQDNETAKADPVHEPAGTGSVLMVPLEEIDTNPFQPRNDFDETAMQELAESIRVQGIIQPVTVRRTGAKSYQLISGERRLRASRLAGLKEIPAYVRAADDNAMLELALIENIQRENLNALEIAISYQRMIDECSLKQEELGGRVGKNRSTVTNYLRLLKLPPVIQAAIRDETISMGHARALIALNGADRQLWVYRQIIERGLSVRKVEELVRAMTAEPVKNDKKPVQLPYEYGKIADGLSSKFGTKVQLRIDNAGKGKIEIPVLSRNDLNRILDILG